MKEKKFEVRAMDFTVLANTENENSLSGLAVAYDSPSNTMFDIAKRQKYKEVILHGAIDFENQDVRCLFSHDNRYVLGRTKNNTLKLETRDDGLYFAVDIPNTTWASDLSKSVKRGDIDKMSFGFYPLESRWLDDSATMQKYGMAVKEISKLHLVEISIVSSPAYSQTSVREAENISNITADNLPIDNSQENILAYENRRRSIEILKTSVNLSNSNLSKVRRV